MASDFAAIQETLDTKGAKILLHHFKRMHTRLYLDYRRAKTHEEVMRIQAKQYALELIPQLVEELMNAHVTQSPSQPKRKEWWWLSWLKFGDGARKH